MTVSRHLQPKPASLNQLNTSTQVGESDRTDVFAQGILQKQSFGEKSQVLSSKKLSLLRREDNSSFSQKKVRTDSADVYNGKEMPYGTETTTSSSKKTSLSRRDDMSSSSSFSQKKARLDSEDVHHGNVKELAEKIEKLTLKYFNLIKNKTKIVSQFGVIIKAAETLRELLPSSPLTFVSQGSLEAYKGSLVTLDKEIETEVQKFREMSLEELSTIDWQKHIEIAMQANSLHILCFVAEHITVRISGVKEQEISFLEVFEKPIRKETISELVKLLVREKNYWNILDIFFSKKGVVPFDLIIEGLEGTTTQGSSDSKCWVLYLSTRLKVGAKGKNIALKIFGIPFEGKDNIEKLYTSFCVSIVRLAQDAERHDEYALFLGKLLEFKKYYGYEKAKQAIRVGLKKTVLLQIFDSNVLSLLYKHKIPALITGRVCRERFVERALREKNMDLFKAVLRFTINHTVYFRDLDCTEEVARKILSVLETISYADEECKQKTLSSFFKYLMEFEFPEGEKSKITIFLKQMVLDHQIDMTEAFKRSIYFEVSLERYVALGFKIQPQQKVLQQNFFTRITMSWNFDGSERLKKIAMIDQALKLGITPLQIADFYLHSSNLTVSELNFMLELIGKSENCFVVSSPNEQKTLIKSFLRSVERSFKPLAVRENPVLEPKFIDGLSQALKLLVVFFDGHTQQDIFQDLFLNILEEAEFYGIDIQFKIAEIFYYAFEKELSAGFFSLYKAFAFLSEKFFFHNHFNNHRIPHKISNEMMLFIINKYFEKSSKRERSISFLKARDTAIYVPNPEHLKKGIDICSPQKKEEINKLNFCEMMNHIWIQLFGEIPGNSSRNQNISEAFVKTSEFILTQEQINQVSALAEIPKDDLSKKWGNMRDQVALRYESNGTPERQESEEAFNKYFDSVEFYLKLYLSHVVSADGTILNNKKALDYVSNLLNSSKVCPTGWRDLAFEVCLQNSGKGSEVSHLIEKTLQSNRKKSIERWASKQNRLTAGNLSHVIADLLRAIGKKLDIPGSEDLIEGRSIVEQRDIDRCTQWFQDGYNAGEIIQVIVNAIGNNTISNQKVADYLVKHLSGDWKKDHYKLHVDTTVKRLKEENLINLIQKVETSFRDESSFKDESSFRDDISLFEDSYDTLSTLSMSNLGYSEPAREIMLVPSLQHDKIDSIIDEIYGEISRLLDPSMQNTLNAKSSMKDKLKVDIKNAILQYWEQGPISSNYIKYERFYIDLSVAVTKLVEPTRLSSFREELYDSETYDIKRKYIAKLLHHLKIIKPTNRDKAPIPEEYSGDSQAIYRKIVDHFYG